MARFNNFSINSFVGFAIADWSGLYLKDVVKMNPELVGLGYAGFSLAMTIGRFSGDFLNKKVGAFKLMTIGFVISVFGILAVLIAQWTLALTGFFVIGLGFSVVVPELYRMAAKIKGVPPTTGVAFIAGAGYVGFLAGPVVLGFIAKAYGLSVSFITMLGLVIIGTVLVILNPIKKSDN